MDWHQERACDGMSADTFFPANGSWHRARKICMSCPVRWHCLDAELRAMKAGVPSDGMFGGLTPLEREQLVGPRRRVGPGSRPRAAAARRVELPPQDIAI